MKALKIKGVSEGIITKLYDNGYDNLKKIINITKNQVLEIDGFKDKSASNLIEALKDIKMKSCNDIMIASNIIGRGLGESKLKLILKTYPFVCNDKKKGLELKVEDLMKINGMGEITSNLFKDNLRKFYEFYEELEFELKEVVEKKVEKPVKNMNKNIKGNSFVFTGFRNEEMEKFIIENGGEVEKNITKKTTHLIIKDIHSKINVKVKKAEEKGIILVMKVEFEEWMK